MPSGDSNLEVIQTEQLIALEEDHTSFEVNQMTIQTEQLLWIKEATHPKVYTWESQAKVHGQKKTLVQSLKQFHAYFYWLYEKGMTQSASKDYMSETFRCSNVSARVGLKSFYPWCLKLGGNTETIAIHLRGSLQDGSCVQHMTVFHGLEWTAHPRSPFWMQSQVWQGMHGTGGTGKGKEVTQEEIQVSGKKGDILITQLWGHQRTTWAGCHSMPSIQSSQRM